MTKLLRRSLPLAAIAAAALGISPVGPTSAAPADWAPIGTATITPGVQTYTDGTNQCTANFVFTDGADVYLGQSAHCAGTGAANETDGCLAASMPLGTPVEIDGASRPGTLAYSSWLTMQGNGESDPDTCLYNDFALVRVDPADHGSVNPSVPFFGGPAGLATSVDDLGAVLSYGSSSLRLGLTALSPKEGVKLLTKGGGWNHVVYTVTPGVPGDSGSGFLDAEGRAFGALSTLNVLPEPVGNGVADLASALAYMRVNDPALAAVNLVDGTEAFTGGRLSLR
jgi:hypothetical protein